MDLGSLLNDVRDHITETGQADGIQTCGVRNMGVLQTLAPKSNSCAVIDPVISLVLQGNKSVQFGTRRVAYAAGDIVVIGQTLPMVSGVISASPATPYIALYIELDMPVLRGVYSDMGGSSDDDMRTALDAGSAGVELVDAIARLFRLRRDPVEERTLGAAALREVYFRVLRSRYGGALRQMIHADSKANQIARAIAHIRREYRSSIKSEDLASIAGMSASVFYETFKQITANTPLQYQKDLRLLEAYDMLQYANSRVSEVAHQVGYESAAQFSREFSRKFGEPPKSVMRALSA